MLKIDYINAQLFRCPWIHKAEAWSEKQYVGFGRGRMGKMDRNNQRGHVKRAN